MTTRLSTTLLAALAILVCTADAGSIKGVIQASAPASDSPGGGGAYASRRYKFLDKIDYDSLRDFVVSIHGVERPADPDNRPRAAVAQMDGAFVPRILPVVVGTEVEWPNRDEIYHNVFSMTEAQPFDLGMYKSSDQAKSLVFNTPGQIDAFCAIHSDMHSVVIVLPNPWFSLSDRRGRFEIPDVPPGTYRLKAWHERLPAKYIDIVVPEEGDLEIDIAMGLADLPKY